MPNAIWRKLTSLNQKPDFNEQAEELIDLAEIKGYRYHRNGKAGEYKLRDSSDKVIFEKTSLTEIYNYIKNN